MLAGAQGDEPVDRVSSIGLFLDLGADARELLAPALRVVQRLLETLPGQTGVDVAAEEEAEQQRVPGRGWAEGLGEQVAQARLTRRGDATSRDAIPAVPSPRRTLERRVALTLLGGVGAFQLALVAGAPWGAAALGGQAPGVLPTSLRVATAVSFLAYGGLAAIVVTDRLSPTARRRTLSGASLMMVLGTVANLASPSPVERLWAPVAATLAVMLWRVRGAQPQVP